MCLIKETEAACRARVRESTAGAARVLIRKKIKRGIMQSHHVELEMSAANS